MTVGISFLCVYMTLKHNPLCISYWFFLHLAFSGNWLQKTWELHCRLFRTPQKGKKEKESRIWASHSLERIWFWRWHLATTEGKGKQVPRPSKGIFEGQPRDYQGNGWVHHKECETLQGFNLTSIVYTMWFYNLLK